nr:immunoglobulin heavy chain junction region [Macaca mulatta]MOY21365.1 immunoglobulin heavy chain junction region [Macaca mulatta]MOY21614.1 immunoglobulin heavy chain junction region [Macaca mulatta]MOY21698.1 immunoglobulin heavy chain junction region [Macaca mulatta]MOY21785.1 immunoglobulin heavy chain junction region [Macaca mulatta]
CARLRNGMDVW